MVRYEARGCEQAVKYEAHGTKEDLIHEYEQKLLHDAFDVRVFILSNLMT